MPRYYFEYWDGQTVSSDNEGVECPDKRAACHAAGKVLLDLAKDTFEKTSSYEFSVEISEQARKPVCRVTLQFEIEHVMQDFDDVGGKPPLVSVIENRRTGYGTGWASPTAYVRAHYSPASALLKSPQVHRLSPNIEDGGID